MRRAVFAAFALVVVVLPFSSASQAANVKKCPAPATCGLYALEPWHWPTDRSGRIVIHYRVNPTQPWLSSAVAIGVWARAARIWEAADDRVDFVYDGTTALVPIVSVGVRSQIDNFVPQTRTQIGPPVNVFGFLPIRSRGELADTSAAYDPTSGIASEADITVDDTVPPVYQPCMQRNGSCTPAKPSPPLTGSGADTRPGFPLATQDLVSLVVHEMGHVLGLAHTPDANGAGLLQTMSPGTNPKDPSLRYQETLGLGDILGVRKLYPCAPACGPPHVFSP